MNLRMIMFACVIFWSSCFGKPVPNADRQAVIRFCLLLNEGDFTKANPMLSEVFYFPSVEEKGDTFRPTSLEFVEKFMGSLKKEVGYVDTSEVSMVSFTELNDTYFNRVGDKLKPMAYEVRYKWHRLYLLIKKGKIASFKIINFGGQPIFWALD